MAIVVLAPEAVGIPGTQAPSEREDEGKELWPSSPSHAVTCTLDTSPLNSGNAGGGARMAPPARVAAIQRVKMATL